MFLGNFRYLCLIYDSQIAQSQVPNVLDKKIKNSFKSFIYSQILINFAETNVNSIFKCGSRSR